jgi:hypothetical protein
MVNRSIALAFLLAGALVVCTLFNLTWAADVTTSILSVKAPTDTALSADPDSPFWKPVVGILADRDNLGNPVVKDIMKIRSRWTNDNLYLLFSCTYSSLHLKTDPKISEETNGLWNWDVAEAFIGDSFEAITRYKEFEVSPQGEWVDLEIDTSRPGGLPNGWLWSSGFKVKARIDAASKLWYAEMCIPIKSISREPALPGLQFRANFFRTQGVPPNRLLLTWRPTFAPTFHVPASFGIIQLSTSYR